MTTEVSLPVGFRAAGVHCGIKDSPQALDVALFVSDRPATGVGVFTQNRVCGAPVKVSRQRVPRATARAVVINSGNANACTGQRGVSDAVWMTAEVAQRLACPADDVLVCSTGLIGRFLPREKLAEGIPKAVAALGTEASSLLAAARAMMTTDTVPKLATRVVELSGGSARVTGVAKGAAMIAPNMATMLAVLLTDVRLAPEPADRLLRTAVDRTFNRITVEGHTSTSDSVILLANGVGGVEPRDDERPVLQKAVDDVCRQLAQAIVRDAEGADHFVTVKVRGVETVEQAVRVAKTVANDALVKTAIAGNDPNWGRIVSCCGRTGLELSEQDVTLCINGTLVFDRGGPTDYDEAVVRESMSREDVVLELSFPFGQAEAEVWTCDLTQEYVRLNSEYTT